MGGACENRLCLPWPDVAKAKGGGSGGQELGPRPRLQELIRNIMVVTQILSGICRVFIKIVFFPSLPHQQHSTGKYLRAVWVKNFTPFYDLKSLMSLINCM